MSKTIDFPKEVGYAVVGWNRFTMSLGKFGFDFGWFPGNPLTGLQIVLFEMRQDYPKGFSGVTILHLQILYFVISLGFNWK